MSRTNGVLPIVSSKDAVGIGDDDRRENTDRYIFGKWFCSSITRIMSLISRSPIRRRKISLKINRKIGQKVPVKVATIIACIQL